MEIENVVDSTASIVHTGDYTCAETNDYTEGCCCSVCAVNGFGQT